MFWKAPPCKNRLVFRANVCKIVKKLVHVGTDKLNSQLTNISERTAIDALETFNVNHNKVFIKDALRNASK